MDELVSFCYLQLAFSAREINLFDLILVCNFRPFVHSCLLGCSREFIVCPAREVYTCYNAVLLDMDELVSFCYLQLAFSAREINLFDLILMCNFRPFVHSCLLGCSRVYILLISPEFLL